MTDFRSIVRAWIDGDTKALASLTPERRRAIGLIAAGVATDAQLEAAGVAFVRGIKAHAPLELLGAVGPVRDAEAAPNTIPWIFSDESPNRHGDIVRQAGWDLENYMRNPVVLWGHAVGFDSVADEPIARAVDLRVQGTRLLGGVLFDVEDDRAARIFRKAKAGFVNAGSVGFKPQKTTVVDDEDERKKLGLGRFGVVFEEQELLEFSLCAIPANPNALRQAVESGALTAADADELGAQRTERDWENYMRRRARSHVAFPAAAGIHEDGVRDGPAGGGILGPALEAIAASQRDLANSLLAQAKAITDLGGCIQALRPTAAPAKAPAAQGPTRAEAEILDILKTMKAHG